MYNFDRATGENDVAFKVMYCGICHSDLHMLKNEWGSSVYPIVPGYVYVNNIMCFCFLFPVVPCLLKHDLLLVGIDFLDNL